MSRRGRTVFEQRWPETPDFVKVAKEWSCDASTMLLTFVWKAYDEFRGDVLAHIDCNLGDEQLERSITQLLEPRIHKVMMVMNRFTSSMKCTNMKPASHHRHNRLSMILPLS